MKKWAVWLMIAAMLLTVFPVSAQTSAGIKTGSDASAVIAAGDTSTVIADRKSLNNEYSNGELSLSVKAGEEWKTVGALSYNEFPQEKQIDLGSILESISGSMPGSDPGIMVRISQQEGRVAHADSVFLGGEAPACVNDGDDFLLKKLSQKDNDVIPIDAQGVEVQFDKSGRDKVLRLTARVEAERISTEEFKFPAANNYREIGPGSEFYSYTLNTWRGSLALDGKLDEVQGRPEFFKEYCIPGSGHPEGYTYGWVMNDDRYLYVAMDFTPDNTMDGSKDYAKVYVKAGDSVKTFKASAADTMWGSPDFTYTGRVSYQHKVYEYKIPLSELGLRETADAQILSLAFGAYGTATPPPLPPPVHSGMSPAMAYDPLRDEYLVVYSRYDDYSNPGGFHVYGNYADAMGQWKGPEFRINDDVFHPYYEPKNNVVYGSRNKKYLVVWEQSSSPEYFMPQNSMRQEVQEAIDYEMMPGIRYQIMDAGQTGETTDGSITVNDGYMFRPSAAYDSDNNRFLVVWAYQRFDDDEIRICGQFIDGSTGEKIGTYFQINTGVDEALDDPAVAYDPVSKKFLVTWDKWFETGEKDEYSCDIYGRFIEANEKGEVSPGSSFSIVGSPSSQQNSRVVYDSVRMEFLLVWEDNAAPEEYRPQIFGAFLRPGIPQLSTAPFLIYDSEYWPMRPEVAYDAISGQALVVRGGSGSIGEEWGQYLRGRFTGPGNAASGDLFMVDLLPGDCGTSFEGAALAANSNNSTFLAAYDKAAFDDVFGSFRCITLKLIGRIKLEPDPITLKVGETCQTMVSAVYHDGENGPVSGSVDYRIIGDGTIAAVDAAGKVTGLKAGSTTIRATYKGRVATVTVNVTPADVNRVLEITPDSMVLNIGESMQTVTASVYSDNTWYDVTGYAVYTSQNSAIASINAQGLVTGISAGTTVVEAVYAGEKAVSTVNVIGLDRITLTPNPINLYVGDTRQTVATAVYSNGVGYDVTNYAVFTLQNTAIAAVSTGGLVTGVSAGTTVVDAVYGGKSVGVSVSVFTYSSPGGGGGGGTTVTQPAEVPPPTANLPAGSIIDRMPGYVSLGKPVKINDLKSEITIEIDKKILEANPKHTARIYYWHADSKKWVALASYPDGDGKVKAVNSVGYKGWFHAFAVLQPAFTDVQGHWAEEVINRMNGLGMVEGYIEDSKVKLEDLVRVARPDKNITRVEFVLFLSKLLNIDPDKIRLPMTSGDRADSILKSRFADAGSIPGWSKDYIASAVEGKIAAGKDGSFHPHMNLSRIEAAVMMSNAFKLLTSTKAADLSSFKDAKSIPEWARDAIVENVISGYPDGTFRPDDNLTRAEALVLLHKLFVRGLGW